MRVLFVSQQRLWRETLEHAFHGMADVVFIPPVGGIEQAIESTLLCKPDVILIDLNPSLFGPRVVAELRGACPDCRIIALSSHADPVAEAQLAAAGINGFLCKDIGVNELLGALRAGSAGQTVFRRNGNTSNVAAHSENKALTARETQVLEQIAHGFANKQIADNLGISIKTVEKHRQRVMEKLQAHETASLTWRAICLGASHRERQPAA